MAGRGYFEDRRPNSNADPYRILFALLSSINIDAEEVSSEGSDES